MIFPKGTIVFTGFGQSVTMEFWSPSGVNLGQPPTMPIPGNGVDGIVALPGTQGRVAIVGGASPNFGTTGIGLFNPDFSVYAQGDAGVHGHPGFSIAADAAGNFYGGRQSGGSGSDWPGGIARYTPVGIQSAAWQVANAGGGEPTGSVEGVAITPDGTLAYYTVNVGGLTPVTVYSYNLSGSAFVGSFATLAGYNIDSHNSLLCLPNGHLVVGWTKSSNPGVLREYAADGSTVKDYSLAGTNPNVIMLTPSLTPTTSFWAIYYDSSLSTHSGVRVVEIEQGTGVILHTFNPADGTFQFDSPAAVLTADSQIQPIIITPPVSSKQWELDRFDITPRPEQKE